MPEMVSWISPSRSLDAEAIWSCSQDIPPIIITLPKLWRRKVAKRTRPRPSDAWSSYARSNEGKFWGRGTEYPPYAQVNEHDTFLIELDQGPCLMYFFHSRWRRAQDVRRWDPTFNEILGCPYVFD